MRCKRKGDGTRRWWTENGQKEEEKEVTQLCYLFFQQHWRKLLGIYFRSSSSATWNEIFTVSIFFSVRFARYRAVSWVISALRANISFSSAILLVPNVFCSVCFHSSSTSEFSSLFPGTSSPRVHFPSLDFCCFQTICLSRLLNTSHDFKPSPRVRTFCSFTGSEPGYFFTLCQYLFLFGDFTFKIFRFLFANLLTLDVFSFAFCHINPHMNTRLLNFRSLLFPNDPGLLVFYAFSSLF